MTEIECVDGFWVIRMPKYLLVLTREEFADGLRRGKWYKRRQARQAIEQAVAGRLALWDRLEGPAST